jgi:hypothetical protein
MQHVGYLLLHNFLCPLYEKLIYCYSEKDASLVINYKVRAILGNLKRRENRLRGRNCGTRQRSRSSKQVKY